jgi:class 3 adenylate cyclase/tetratricopeptide (TPR) repeat protein
MSFLETVRRAKAYLEEQGRVSLRALALEFALDEAQLEALVAELADVQQVAARDRGALAWAGAGRSRESAPAEPARDPRDYTPRHLAEKILRSKSALEGERKEVTVLFADVKSSTALAEALDAEEWHRILDRYFQVLTEGVHRFEGTVNQYTGDGIMALFGAPIAHEDHAQRACYAALWLRDALRRLSEELRLSRGLDFAARMGLHTGEVVVGKIGDDLRMDYTAQGHTVGLAARMEGLAPPGGVCVSEATARLVSGYVALRDLGVSRIKGASEPVRVFELEGPGEIQSRFDLARARGLTRFVGRDADMAVLEQALAQARAGNGQVVGVVAEAGAGKSRLCFEFLERCRAQGLTVLQGAAAAHGRNVPLLPILRLFRQYFGIGEQDGERAAREKIAGRLRSIDESVRELLPVVFDFMGVSDPERPAPRLDPEARQRQLFGVMRRVIGSGDGVTVAFIEDLHWIDAASEAWVEQMVEATAGTRTLLLVNFRPEYHAGWMQKSWYRQLPLLPLGPEAFLELLQELLGNDPSSEGLPDAVHARTAGNPFFAEEIVQNLIESGSLEGGRGGYRLTTPVDELEVPGTVQSVLAARIDRLGEREKQALQAASVIGREFSEPILATVLGWPEGDLSEALQALKRSEFLYEQSLYPVAEYAFKHPLTQEVALGSQLRERRARTHAAVARAIEATRSDRLDEHAALLAHHWEAAGEALQAARWHRRAANWLLAGNTPASMTHWKRVYELAGSQPDTRETLEMRFEACGKLVIASYQLGIPRDERDRLAAEGREIAERLGDRVALFTVDLYLAISQLLAGWSREAPLVPTQRAVALADELDLGLEMRVLARVNCANIAWTAGRVSEALRASEEALELAGGNLDLGMHVAGFSIPNLALYVKGGLLQWLGRPREAVDCLERCRAVASARGEMIECQLISQAAPIEELTGISQMALVRCLEAVELGERQGDLFNRTITTLHLGWAQLMHGDAAGAVESLLRVDQLQRERGVGSNHLNLGQGLLAEALLAAGDATRARIVANRCTAELDAWVWELRAHLSRARVLRALDGADARVEIEASLTRADLLLEWSGARAFAPFIVEERARLAAVLGDEAGAANLLRQARVLFAEVEATGHVERLTRELGA